MPPGLRRSDAILQTTFDVETPSEQVRLVVARTEVWIAEATARAAHEVARDRRQVEVALVHARPLEARNDLADRVPDRAGVLLVERVARPEEDRVRAAAQRLGRAHRRVDPEPARDVVRGRDDPAAVRVAADHERLLAERRVLELLDGGEERVEVEVGEDRRLDGAQG